MGSRSVQFALVQYGVASDKSVDGRGATIRYRTRVSPGKECEAVAVTWN